MNPMNSLSYIQNVMYKLKLDYGFPIDLYRFTSEDIATDTGVITRTRVKYEIPLAVIMSEQDSRKFAYSRAFIAENRAFTYGGYFDVGIRMCILDAMDLPVAFVPLVDDYLVAEEIRYQVTHVGNLMGDYGFLMALKETKGLEPFQILTIPVCSKVCLRQGTNNG
jgi:hypothetical protein